VSDQWTEVHFLQVIARI